MNVWCVTFGTVREAKVIGLITNNVLPTSLSPPYMMIVKFFNYVSSTLPKKTRVAKFSNVFNIVFYKCLSYLVK